MRLRRKLNKGFTLVELIVVIAIIAILAAVSAVSYIAFINQANESADQQAVTQINEVLKASDALERPSNVKELFDLLSKNGLNAKDYKPLFKDRFYFWDESINRVLYTDNSYKTIYPTAYADRTKDGKVWYTLSGKVREEKPATIDTGAGTVTVTSVEQLSYVMNNFQNATKVTLNSNIDAMGSVIEFKPTDNFEIDGGGKTISNFISIDPNYYDSSVGKSYLCGLIPEVKLQKNATIKNLTLDNAFVGSYDTGSCAFLIGKFNGGQVDTTYAKIVIDNVKITNSTVIGKNKVSTLIGQNNNFNDTNITNSSFKNVVVSATEGEAGKLIGSTSNSIINIDSPTISSASSNVKLNLESSTRKIYEGPFTVNGTLGSGLYPTQVELDNITNIVERLNSSLVFENAYRSFCKNALFSYANALKYNSSVKNSRNLSGTNLFKGTTEFTMNSIWCPVIA